MNSAIKIILVLAVLAGAAIAFLMFNQDGSSGPVPFAGQQQEEADQPEDPGTARAADPVDLDPVRVDDPGESRTDVRGRTDNAGDLPQGIAGRAVDPGGFPLAGVEVSLRKIVPGGIFGPILQKQQGIGNTPIAVAETDESGRFQLGVRTVEEGALEMWFTGPQSIDKNLKGVALEAGAWTEMGDVTLERGAILFGRVSDERTGAPIQGAIVYANNPIAAGINPAPGRDLGVPTSTDINGDYRFENVAEGALQVQVHAEGYARVSDQAVRVTMETPAQKDFVLPIGRSIDGVVTDADGNGIAGANVSAVCLSTKTPMKVDVRTDRDGFFLLEGLVDAPFQINATAAGFLRATVQPIQAGEQDQHIVLEKQGGARVRVTGSDGRRLNNYSVLMLRYFEKNDQYGAAHDIPMRQVRARDLDADGAFVVEGLNPGDYAFEIYAKQFAKTRSEPFKVAAGIEPPLIEVTMKNGGMITGQILGPDGQPIAGVEVETVPPNLVNVPFLRDLQHLMTTEITRAKTKTDGQGRYRISALAPATYQIKVSHPSAYVKYVKGVVVADEQTTDVETVKLERGTRVWGSIRVDGRPEAGVKVTITAAVKPGAQGLDQIAFTEETVTNERGEFEFPRRIPPGRYTLRAGRQQGNPLLIMLDYKKTEQEITFANEDSFEYSPNIVSN